MRKILLIVLAAVAAIAINPTMSAAAETRWNHMGATIATERDTLVDTVTIPELTGYSGLGAGSAQQPVGAILSCKTPFSFIAHDAYSGVGTVATYVDSAGVFVHLPATPYTLIGPVYACNYEYRGVPTILQFTFAAADTAAHANRVQVTPVYKLPK